jgi:hypothetical protein
MKIVAYTFIILFLNTTNLVAQSITPFTVNIAGFSGEKSGYSLTVSTGETISITNFNAANGVSLNSGFLQNNPPIVTGIEDILSKIGVDEITIAPNPTSTITNLVSNFIIPGQLQYQVLDINSKILYRSDLLNQMMKIQIKVDLSTYPVGVYYIQVFYKASSKNLKTGMYKIIKL